MREDPPVVLHLRGWDNERFVAFTGDPRGLFHGCSFDDRKDQPQNHLPVGPNTRIPKTRLHRRTGERVAVFGAGIGEMNQPIIWMVLQPVQGRRLQCGVAELSNQWLPRVSRSWSSYRRATSRYPSHWPGRLIITESSARDATAGRCRSWAATRSRTRQGPSPGEGHAFGEPSVSTRTPSARCGLRR